MIRSYSELSQLSTFVYRYRYLKLNGSVAEETFGFDRYINQVFYKSPEWKAVRDFVIVRDNGCDLGVNGYEIHGTIFIHHMNPIPPKDIVTRSYLLLDPDYLIDASAIAECFQSYVSSYLHYFRRKFEPAVNTHYILLGNLANFFLDELIYA